MRQVSPVRLIGFLFMKAPAFQFYANDFLGGTAFMTAEEVGAYIRLLCYSWDKGAIPNDDRILQRLAGCSTDALVAVRQKFAPDSTGWLVNARLENVRDKQRAYSQRQTDAAKHRWDKSKLCHVNATAYATEMPPHMPEGMPERCSPTPTPTLSLAPAKTVRAEVSAPTDEQWLTGLSLDPTYAGIDVKREFGKMSAWCATNKKQASRRRFVNWLNRVERPMGALNQDEFGSVRSKAW